MDFPQHHRRIVEDLTDGKFILQRDEHFRILKEQESFYCDFFEESFGYKLNLSQEYAYLSSDESNEMLSRDVSIFFSLLCYELDRDGRNFLDEIQFSEFEVEQIDQYMDNSSFSELIASNNRIKDKMSRRTFLKEMRRRNIIEMPNDERFSFTDAHKLFIDYARQTAQSRLASAELDD